MKYLTSLFIAIAIITTLSAQDITGKWSGNLDIMGQKLPIVFHISKEDTVYITKMDSPAQNAFKLPTDKTTFNNNRLEVVANGLGIFFQGILESDSIRGIFNQGGMALPLILKQDELPVHMRPQTPTPPYPYKIEEVTFANTKDDISLSGTITIPDTIGTFPAVILVAGSGPNDRDETIFEHKPFWVIADYLTRNGFIVLRYDKRGIGSSTGKYELATTSDFAEDAKHALDYLKTHKDVDKNAIGIIGHSEGGIIAPMIAAKSRDIKFVVMLAGMGTKGIDLIMEQNKIALNEQRIELENIEELLNITRNTLQSLSDWEGSDNDRTSLRDQLNLLWDKTPLIQKMKMNKDQYIRSNLNAMSSRWFREFILIDPTVYLKKVKCPVLALNGANDTQVVADENIRIIEASLKDGGNKNFEVKIYPKLNHLFQESETGKVDEYIKIEQTISPEVLTDITNWIISTIKQ